jgi:uncharacterized membrane protein
MGLRLSSKQAVRERNRLFVAALVGALIALAGDALLVTTNEVDYRRLTVAVVSADGDSVCFEGGECAAPIVPVTDIAMVGQEYCVGWVMARPPSGLGGRQLVELRPVADC